jgi:hypothetical protein
MKELIGKKFGNVEFIEYEDRVYGQIYDGGATVQYELKEVSFGKPIQAVLMDLDGTTLNSEEFWIYIIEKTVAELIGNSRFSLEQRDIPFVSGFTTTAHLEYCIKKYCPDRLLRDAMQIYHRLSEEEMAKVGRGEGNENAFRPSEGLKEFLLELKARKIKIGLATSGLDYKSIPEIVSVFRRLNMGDPLDFYDAIITGGRRKDVRQYGTIGELAAKPHPWLYSELAYMGLKIVNPSTVVGIEDSAAGIMSLRFAGFTAFGLKGGNIKSTGLSCLCYDLVQSLPEILKKLS